MRRRLAMSIDNHANFITRGRAGRATDPVECELGHRRAKRRRLWRHRLPGTGSHPVIPDLTEDLPACSVYGVCESGEGGNVLLQIRRRLKRAATLMCGAAQDHQAATAIPHALGAVRYEILRRRGPEVERNGVWRK